MSQDAEILFADQGGIGCITLNRPKALNALTHGMARQLDQRLRAWETDPAIQAVVIRGQGSRAFCAGGDIRQLYERGRDGDYSLDFYRDEYRLNARIRRFPKPYIAFLDGIVMGGGVGVSVHGSHRVVTENTVFAMPETGIGLFPDVGGSFFLPRCPGQIGMYLGLTGARLKAADALYAGVGTQHVPSARLDALQAALAEAASAGPLDVDAVLKRFAEEPGEAALATRQPLIDRTFAGASVEEILAALDAEDDAQAAEIGASIRAKSPVSLKIAYRQLRQGASLDMDGCMRMEWRIVNRLMPRADFYEGVRAAIIDKDQAPVWQPARLEEVTAEEVDRFFAPLPEGDLSFDWDGAA